MISNEKFCEFENFINDLKKNQSTILSKLANLQDTCGILEREEQVISTIIPSGKRKEQEARDKAAANPKDAVLAAEVVRMTALNQQAEDRLSVVRAALADTREQLARLEAENAGLNPEPYAESAMDEQFSNVVTLQEDLSRAVENAEAKRIEYLESLIAISAICNEGNHCAERMHRAHQLAPNKAIPAYASFEVRGLARLVVDLDSVKAAVVRGRIR